MESGNAVNPNVRFQASNVPNRMVTAEYEVEVRTIADQIPTAPGWTHLWVPPFEVDIPENLPIECWKDEIRKKLDVVHDNVIENARISSDFEERLILEPKQEDQGSDEISMVRWISRNQTSHGVSAQLEAHNMGSMHQITEPVVLRPWSLEEKSNTN